MALIIASTWTRQTRWSRDCLKETFQRPDNQLKVIARKVPLGTWQSLVLVDLNVDNPRRQVRFTFVAA